MNDQMVIGSSKFRKKTVLFTQNWIKNKQSVLNFHPNFLTSLFDFLIFNRLISLQQTKKPNL